MIKEWWCQLCICFHLRIRKPGREYDRFINNLLKISKILLAGENPKQWPQLVWQCPQKKKKKKCGANCSQCSGVQFSVEFVFWFVSVSTEVFQESDNIKGLQQSGMLSTEMFLFLSTPLGSVMSCRGFSTKQTVIPCFRKIWHGSLSQERTANYHDDPVSVPVRYSRD